MNVRIVDTGMLREFGDGLGEAVLLGAAQSEMRGRCRSALLLQAQQR